MPMIAPAVSTGTAPVVLGDLPVDTSGMVIGDAAALDAWIGFVEDPPAIGGLADLLIGGNGDAEAWARFGAPPIPTLRNGDQHGWLDLPVDAARERREAINQWAIAHGHHRYLATVSPHSHHYLGRRRLDR